MLSALGPIVLSINQLSQMTCPQSCRIWAVPACSQHNHILSWGSSLWLEHWSHLLVMLTPPCWQFSAILPLAVSQAIPTKKILFCIADFIFPLLNTARVLQLCRIYTGFFIFRYILALLLAFSRVTFLLVTIKPVSKVGHNFVLCLLPYVLQSSITLENSLYCANISWNLPYCSSSYSCQLPWQMLFYRNLGLEARSLLSFFVLICILSCLTIDSAVSPSFFFFPQFGKKFLFSPVFCRSAAAVPLL